MEEVGLTPVLTGVGAGATNTFEVATAPGGDGEFVMPAATAATYGFNSAQPHSHFSVMSQERLASTAVLNALQATPDTFPVGTPVTAIEAMALTTTLNTDPEWNLMSWGGKRGSNLWHASPAETLNSVAPARRRTAF